MSVAPFIRRVGGSACVTILLVVMVALLAGCGGSSGTHPTPPYVKQVNAVANGLDSVTNDLYTPTDPSSAAAELTTVEAALRKAAAQLAAITPPRAIKSDHARLVKAMNELANGVGPLIAKLKAGNIEAAASAFSFKGVADARTAIAAIKRAGYEIQFPLLS